MREGGKVAKSRLVDRKEVGEAEIAVARYIVRHPGWCVEDLRADLPLEAREIDGAVNTLIRRGYVSKMLAPEGTRLYPTKPRACWPTRKRLTPEWNREWLRFYAWYDKVFSAE